MHTSLVSGTASATRLRLKAQEVSQLQLAQLSLIELDLQAAVWQGIVAHILCLGLCSVLRKLRNTMSGMYLSLVALQHGCCAACCVTDAHCSFMTSGSEDRLHKSSIPRQLSHSLMIRLVMINLKRA